MNYFYKYSNLPKIRNYLLLENILTVFPEKSNKVRRKFKHGPAKVNKVFIVSRFYADNHQTPRSLRRNNKDARCYNLFASTATTLLSISPGWAAIIFNTALSSREIFPAYFFEDASGVLPSVV